MKGFLIWVFLIICSLASARVFFVQDPAYNALASDINPGTDIVRPWATWQKAFNTARAGDTVYFRGGTWYPRSDIYGNVTMHYPSNGNGYNGSFARPVCFFAYPPDVAEGNWPVLDCRYTHPSTNNHVGLYISDSRHVKFKGLQITHVRSWPIESGEMWCAGIMAQDFEHLSLEQMTTSFIGGVGCMSIDFDTLYLVNCDSYNNCDSLDVSLPGNDADGFTVLDQAAQDDTLRIAYIHGCRAWNNSDDGFEISNSKQLDVRECWSWNNGYLEGDPNGYKLNYSDLRSTWKRKIYHCISAYNERTGFVDLNLHADRGPFMEYLNNTSFQCGAGFGSGKGEVFDCSQHPASVIYRNNISHAYSGSYPATFKACDYGFPSYVTQDHNTWVQTGDYFYTEANPAYKLSSDDFISLDSSQLRWPRKPDGSLPEITFLQLASNSDLIDGGVDVGLAFFGKAPDLGAFEYGDFSIELTAPWAHQEFKHGDPIQLKARVEGGFEKITEVLFYAESGGRQLGSGEQVAPGIWEYTWEPEVDGRQKIRAVAFSSQGETATSSVREIRIRWPAGYGSMPAGDPEFCKIIPNPNHGHFSIELKEPLDQNSDIQIISVVGQVVAVKRMARDEFRKELNLSALPSGIYSVRLSNVNDFPFFWSGFKLMLD